MPSSEQKHQRQTKALWIVKRAMQSGQASLLEYEAEQIARMYRIPVVKGSVAHTEKEALVISKKIGFPLVLKIISPDIVHKTEIGGVITNINYNSELKKGFREIISRAKKVRKDANIRGIFVQKMAQTHEFVVGGIRDPHFGPTVMFGLGGIYVELYRDVSFRIAPISTDEAISMMQEIKAAALLSGFRGSKPLDMLSLASVIQAVAYMMIELKEIESIDINPLLVYENGCKAVDVRIILVKRDRA